MSFSALILMMIFIALGLLITLLSSEVFYRIIGVMFIVLGITILVGFRSQMIDENKRQDTIDLPIEIDQFSVSDMNK